MVNYKSEFLKVIAERGFLHQCTDLNALDEKASSNIIPAYIGFDCTAPSLHVGSLLPIMLLRWLQKTGHKPIVLMGGGTTKVGDPSGKDESRQLLTEAKINNNLDKFNYNVIVANMYETYNFLIKKINMPLNGEKLKENYIKILSSFSPIIPHFTSECFEDINLKTFQEWPVIDKKLLEKTTIQFVIQINGKKRGSIEVNKDISENEMIDKVKSENSFKKLFAGKNINKIFFVKNRLINFLTS